jgi:hypothetical protein
MTATVMSNYLAGDCYNHCAFFLGIILTIDQVQRTWLDGVCTNSQSIAKLDLRIGGISSIFFIPHANLVEAQIFADHFQ